VSLADELKKPNAKPVYLVTTTAGEHLQKFIAALTALTISGLAESSTEITVSWTLQSQATGYKVYRDGVLIATTTAASYADSGLSLGVTYNYTVYPYNAIGTGPVSNTLSAATLDAPTGLAAARSGTAYAHSLTWDASGGATSYNIYRSTTSGSGFVLHDSSATNSYTDTTSLSANTVYYYTVTMVNGLGESGQSSEASVRSWAVYDTFTRANTSAGVGMADSGQTWTTYGGRQSGAVGNHGITSNKVYLANYSANLIWFAGSIDSGLASCTITATIKALNGTYGGALANVCARLSDEDTFFSFRVTSAASGTAEIYRWNSGGGTLIGSAAGVGASAVDDEYEIVLNGNGITFKRRRAGVLTTLCSATDSQNNTATLHGIASISPDVGTVPEYDDFKVVA
jgi:hypothetical protein